MNEAQSTRIVAALRSRGVMAHVYRAATYRFGVRVVIPDGREAIWDDDGTADLEARVMRNGMLVGFVPRLPGSESWDDSQVIDAIARTDYDAL